MTRKIFLPMLLVGFAGTAMAAGVGIDANVGASVGGMGAAGANVGVQQHTEASSGGLEKSTTRLQENIDRSNANAETGLNTAIDAQADAQGRIDAKSTEAAGKAGQATDIGVKKTRHASKRLKSKADATASKAQGSINANVNGEAKGGGLGVQGSGSVQP